ncbi:aminobutyraldehyde dehydrogenase [Corynebacterium felinum]|uniref:1-pyrroline dehydrogenase n=1 Tax=Corynebacterium felinum TaxID=131318 RepID=A0ABU2B4M2_9CORY|nr:aminobutyraldehyde dehydrogenase [Corynebacterium felinum]MDF5820624.1 aminobutyraldehyde dehydrogenase [Corynebacterium felinum]MDR7353553.1 1-pyrroline dehydrogenase [Corynebacterium felinum]WJY95734.1 Gamma-aminobutyraldehyde dehydrogenase [Corynebacterium felinum]
MDYLNFIDNEFVSASGQDTVELISPVTEESLGHAPISNAEDIDRAVQAAEKAFTTWRRTTPSERQKCLLALADLIEENAAELAAIQSRETGQITAFVQSEECLAGADHVRFFAGAARMLNGLATGEYMEGHTSSIRREAIGVIAQVAPWNYPLMMAIWKIAPALAAGNTVVLKPSDTTPGSTVKLAELVASCFPPGVVNIVLGDATTGATLVAHPVVRMVSITGSVPAGRAVGRSAGENLKRSHLELGGKAPVIVCKDADLQAAAEGIAAAGLFNAGQDCTASTRVLVDEQVAEKFSALLVAEAQKLRPGKPEDTDAFYGALNNKRHFDKVMQVLADLPEHATILTGGKRIGEVGYYVEPTIVAGLKQQDKAIQEETFGPVITLQTFTDIDQALDMSNDVSYGLASSVWTTNLNIAERASRELEFGCVWINCHIPLVAEMPHGGFKDSGYGKDLSLYSLEEYTRIKHVMTAH